MSEKINIEAGTLVVLSGLPGAGKTRLRARSVSLPEGAWVSMDAMRLQMLGSIADLRDGRRIVDVRQDANDAVFEATQIIVRTRLRHGLTTVVDATSVSDADRKAWVDLADAAGAPHLVVILATSLDSCLQNMKLREDWVHEAAVREMHQPTAAPQGQNTGVKSSKPSTEPTPPTGFMLSSRFNHAVVDSDVVLNFVPRSILSSKVDVIGDVHGLLANLLALLALAGWTLVGGRLRHADPERRLLFLGDLVDRGPDSIEVIELVMQAVRDGLAQCVLGNHENKLADFVDTALSVGIQHWTSYGNAETGMKMLALPEARRQAIMTFIRTLPYCLVHEKSKTAFVHGNMLRFDPFLSIKGDMVYGQTGWTRIDSDEEYEKRYQQGYNEYTLIRGHIPDTSEQNHILSLEKHGFQRGELLLLPFDAYLAAKAAEPELANRAAFTRCVLREQCEFDFDAYSETRFRLIREMEKLVSAKLAVRYLDETKMLRGYKYSREVFWKHSWSESEWLLKARGVVMDPSGALVSHPFTKVFNFGEEGAGSQLTDDTEVVAVDKLNGFLGIVSANPVKKGELLAHTQGGMGGEFVEFITSFIDPKTKGLLCRFFAKRKMTLMFEVLHPEDPHIVAYPPEMMGLHLIGARGLGFDDEELTESEVDEIAAELGMRRPKWTVAKWGDVRHQAREAQHEGWMIRANTAKQEFILKLKTPFYLTTKFIGRLSDKKVKHLYGNPRDFKKQVDEELYPVVDAVVARFTLDEFLQMSDEHRIPRIRALINELQ